jgi:cysteine synthase A
MHALGGLLGRKVGPSTGTNFVAMLRLANEMRAAQTPGSVLSLLCDAGERYEKTYHDATWVKAQFGDVTPARHHLATLMG